jgi:UDP-N-acetyl-D-mannosaminuronate dehydrogenase
VIRLEDGILTSTDALEAAGQADVTVIVTDHAGIDYKLIAGRTPLILDTRNALRGVVAANIIRL